MSDQHILVIDEGTTSTRAILYRPDGTVAGSAQRELTQFYPQPGRVEHDADEIWEKSLSCARMMVERAGGASRIAAIGITNQRETIVAWDKRTAKPIGRAIVWQDRRTAPMCASLREAGHEPFVQARTGLVLDPYFSASKMRWILDNIPETRELGDALALGTVESWLVWKLTGGVHVSDASNASRTQLLALDGQDWDSELLDLFGVPRGALPQVVDCFGALAETDRSWFGEPIPICGLAGDQQAATIGQNCLRPGQTKATLGTGAFILTNMGDLVPRSTHRLLGTVLYQHQGKRSYALEGSVFTAGSLIKWLRDELGLIASAAETDALARSVPSNGGVSFLPALSGLGAPHWLPEAHGLISGLTHGASKAHIVRAALEAISHQVRDLQTAFAADQAPWASLRLDGGMSANDWIAQDLADMLDLEVVRPDDVETTALGAAMLAGTGCGLFSTLGHAAVMCGATTGFHPAMPSALRDQRLQSWDELLRHAAPPPRVIVV